MNSRPSKTSLFTLPLIFAAVAFVLYFGALKPDALHQALGHNWAGNAFIDRILSYQLSSLLVALALLGLTALLAPASARRFYRPGDLNAPAQKLAFLGIKPGDGWKQIGLTFALIITAVTGIFIYLNVAKGQSIAIQNQRFVPFIILFALINSFVEEGIFRLAWVTSLSGHLDNKWIEIGSALLFGIPHFFGTPGGIVGSLMAGFLGWLLARSVIETKGFFWAWLIHFLQDLVIFTGLFMAAL